jgi:hypothetical protein
MKEVYTRVDPTTGIHLRTLALDAGIDPEASRADIAEAVAGYISSAASYTLSPPVTPYGEDFALYFLTNSKRGYCIHFATAATLMLRSLGVPARFTSGFVATVPADSIGQTVEVTDGDAHAWVEVYYDNIGWAPLEVTPASPGYWIPGLQLGNGFASGFYEPEVRQSQDQAETGAKGVGNNPKTNSAGFVLLYTALWMVIIIAVLILRRFITDKLRARAFRQEDTNKAVISAWRHISRLCPKLMPDEIEETGLKARFSRHRITEDERGAIINCAIKLAGEKYRECGFFRRIWIRYVRGL